MNPITTKNVKYINFLNLDYCRPISIDASKGLYLYDEDLYAFFGKTISQQFIFTLKKTCLLCHSAFQDDKEEISMLCECRLCKRCVAERIQLATEGKIVLNAFEKSKNLMF